MLKHVRRMIAVPVAILALALVFVLPGIASAHSKAPRTIKVAGTYSYTNTVPNTQTLTIDANGTLTFSPEGCSGLWAVTGRAFGYQVPAGSCDQQVAVGKAKIVKVKGAKKVQISGKGTYLKSGVVLSYTWKAVQK